MAIQDVEESLDIVNLDPRPAMHILCDYPERLVLNGPTHPAADRGVHDFPVRATGSAAFEGESLRDVIVEGEGCSVRHIMKFKCTAS